MVAIDRLHGGAAEGLKFNVEFVMTPTLDGVLTLDLMRIAPWGLGLLALTLRDLVEGDVTFGFGASKGYGAGRLRVSEACIAGRRMRQSVEQLLVGAIPGGPAGHSGSFVVDGHDPEIQEAIRQCVLAFRHKMITANADKRGGDDGAAIS